MKRNESQGTPNRNNTPLLGITPCLRASREYSVMVMRHGGQFDYWPAKTWRSSRRIREFTHIFFRKWFGRAPDRLCWHKDGFMAECSCRRGFVVQVEQVNHGDPRFRLLPTPWTKAVIEAQFNAVNERRAS